jgi:hypothetical protein
MSKIYVLCINTAYEDYSEVLRVSRRRETLEQLAATDWMQNRGGGHGLEDWLPITWTKLESTGSLFPHEQWRGEMARDSNHYYTIDEMEESHG